MFMNACAEEFVRAMWIQIQNVRDIQQSVQHYDYKEMFIPKCESMFMWTNDTSESNNFLEHVLYNTVL